MLKLILTLGLLLALAAIASVIFKALDRKAPRPPASAAPPPYERKPILTGNERDFFLALRTAIGPDTLVFPQMPVASFTRVKLGTDALQSWHNRIDRKTVDFLLVEAKSLQPIFAIEVDDASHQRSNRIERDKFVEQVCETIGLPLRRFEARHAYSPAEIRAALVAPN